MPADPVQLHPEKTAQPPIAPRAEAPVATDHTHAALDRLMRAEMARFTDGVSPYATAKALTDWALHLARAPGRQMELAERAAGNMGRLWAHTLRSVLPGDDDPEPPFRPGPHDHRFAHPGWATPPFSLMQQNFLALQDWWEAATETIRGMDRRNADRTRFMVRQALDTLSPSNFPLTSPEIIETTRDEAGANLLRGQQAFWRDMIQELSGDGTKVPEGFTPGERIACTPDRWSFATRCSS